MKLFINYLNQTMYHKKLMQDSLNKPHCKKLSLFRISRKMMKSIERAMTKKLLKVKRKILQKAKTAKMKFCLRTSLGRLELLLILSKLLRIAAKSD